VKRGARRLAVSILLAPAPVAHAQTPAPAPTSACVDGGRVVDLLEFADGSRVRVLERAGETFVYESISAKGAATTMVTTLGLVTHSAASAAGTVLFSWQGDTQGLSPFKEGATHAMTGTLKRPDGTEAHVGAELHIGPSEVVEIVGCRYPVIKITTINTINGNRSKVVRYFHEKSMLSLRTIVLQDLPDGTTREAVSFSVKALN